MNTLWIIIALIAGGVLGGIITHIIGRAVAKKGLEDAQDKAQTLLREAETEVSNMKKAAEIEVKEKFFEKQKENERELKNRRIDIERLEKKLQGREQALDRKFDALEKRDRGLADKEKVLEAKIQSYEDKGKYLDKLQQEIQRKLEQVSGMTCEEAKKNLIETIEKEARQDAAGFVRRIESETKEVANKKARQIITLAIQKTSIDQVSETTVSVVPLPNDDIKGRIIGREGRNIRALEAATGCNIIVDDTPEAVVLSSFDPLRREVAKIALEKLISDGRIHPGRIEELVAKTEKDVMDTLREIGERVAFDLGIHELHPELIKLLGRLKYRTSYGQNVLLHSQEVAYLCQTMAAELGVDSTLAKRAGLLHDIGKAVSYEMEGTHSVIGAELARKYNEPPAIVHSIAAHHLEEEPRTIIAVLVQAADAISAARPGARRETLESYIKRLEKLEGIASSFSGVEKSFAIQAGREIRIIVEPAKVNDEDAVMLARDITKRIEKELEYPGQIKVTVVRETRAVEYAR